MEGHTLTLTEDRGLAVPAGATISTGYARIDRVRLACRDRMAIGDVDLSMRRLLQTAPAQPWPPPVGRWDGEIFEIHDGRHAYVAALMLGYEALFVAWITPVGEKEEDHG